MSETRVEESSEFFGRWRKSHYSYDTGACCEVLNLTTGLSFLRDSQNPNEAQLAFGNLEWSTFLTVAKGADRA